MIKRLPFLIISILGISLLISTNCYSSKQIPWGVIKLEKETPSSLKGTHKNLSDKFKTPSGKTKDIKLFQKKWLTIDEGTVDNPSSWFKSGNVIIQSSNILGGSNIGQDPVKPGTFVIDGNKYWADYTLTASLRSRDDDAIGIIFRYQPNLLDID